MAEIELLDLDLDSPATAQLVGELAHSHGAPLAQAIALPTHLFLLRSPWMPGLRFVGGKASALVFSTSEPISLSFNLSGAGEQLGDALASCVGEAVERLSQVEQPGDIIGTWPYSKRARNLSPSLHKLVEEALHRNKLPRNAPLDWVQGKDLHDGSPLCVPADWCLRRSEPGPLLDPTAALSSGVAAGSSFEDAAVRAILELIERDAAALWWDGGVNGRPIACEGSGMAEAARLLTRLRAGSSQRTGWLLDISTDVGVPVVAALSFDNDGSAFACGLGAASTQAGAVRKALLELGQMELGFQVAARKQRTDGATLSEVERRHLARAAQVHAESCRLLQPLGAPRAQHSNAPNLGLDALKALLAKNKMRAAVIDHTRPSMPIPVVQVICPELQPLPSSRRSGRLRRATQAMAGNEWSNQIPLL
jgi:ribosomal protein S12 methylthiotransferase accessory factor